MTKTIIKAGADAGNNGLKLITGDQKPLMIPSTYAIYAGQVISMMDLPDIPIDELEKAIDVTIVSPAIDFNGRYIVGQKVLTDQMDAIEMERNSDKSTDEIPVIVTLAGLAIDAMRRFPDQDSIEISYDLSVALPIKTIDIEKVKRNEKRFKGTHKVTYHHPSGRDVEIEIRIEFCKCLAEGAAAAWGVVYDEKGQLVERKFESVGEVTLENKLQLHFDIGAGTIEMVVTNGVALQHTLSDGLPYGTKATILDLIKIWNKNNPVKTIDSIVEFNEIFFNSEHPRHNDLLVLAEPSLRALAVRVSKEIINKIDSMKDDPFVFIYGGGSILLKEYLQKILKNRNRDLNVMFLNDPMFVNARGLYVYTNSPRFVELKENALGVVKDA